MVDDEETGVGVEIEVYLMSLDVCDGADTTRPSRKDRSLCLSVFLGLR